MAEINKLLEILNNEVGYLEKSRTAYNQNPTIIYDKTAGAGKDNITKYAKEMDELNVYNGPKQGYAWCKVFIDWCFVQSFGIDRARELLKGWTAGVTQTYNWFKSANAISSSPEIGDLIIFGNCDHIGVVENIANGRVYTIEGNTSSQEGVVANGGAVAKKSYVLGSSYIKCYAKPAYDGSIEPQPQPTPTPSYPLLKKGDSGNSVRDAQNKLISKGYNCGKYGADGVFGSDTEKAVKEIQRDAEIEVDGIIGNDTWNVLNGPFVKPTSKYVLGLYQVNTPSGLNVRKSPVNGAIIKTYPNGTRFDTYELQDNWAQTPSGWVCLDYCKLIRQY